jgi:outer membrane protein assembly factor BamB
MMLSHCAGQAAVGEGVLFVAGDTDCWMLSADTGRLLHKFSTVDREHDWGYVGTFDDYLLGSDQRPAADEYSTGKRKRGYKFLTSARDLQSRPTVSLNLFAFDYRTRQRIWTYDRSSAILNSTITVGNECVFFAESRNPSVLADETGTAWLPAFFARGARLVALDLHDGSELWSQPLGPLSASPGDEHEHIMFLSYADGLLLVTRTGHIDQKLSYRLEARDAGTGETRWQQTLPSRHRIYAPLTYGKNGQQSHPSIVGGKVFLLSHITDALITLDLQTGRLERDPALYDFWIHSKTCAVPTASASGLYFRRDSCYMLDLPSRRAIDLTTVTRPGCWMSIIPAGGLVLMPEASSGCTCGFALQTSVVLAPASR